MRRLLPLLLLASAVVLGACGTPAADGGAGPAPSDAAGPGGGTGISQAENDLRIDVDRGDGSPPESWTLVCVGFVEGTHPQAQAACDHLAGMTDPFAPIAADTMCIQQYGGPQTARITGRWQGGPVDLELSRVDGCRIAQWDSLGPVLPVPVTGVQPLG
ncbi:SSI family serine proteinase inhibitor [Blastococcus saxobsidens]|uniref:Subtilisin inhibitor-like n=1 Tax=Blastococcus saxobsidens TaxID=138336 RepID=A0A4Q7Y5V8_9ACTN|nr:SSI family serine proteinase inhibitor [Blastococcus saxobsidens]RZU31513.1 subtilisin inhibitor-like [Blastococcus saxobsidens]